MEKKGFVAIILGLLVMIGLFATPVALSAAETQVKVLVNGKAVAFPDAKPFIDKNGRTQVPVRFVAEALKGTVDWDDKTKTVTVKRGMITAKLTINKKEITVLNVKKTIDSAPIIQNSRTFVPLRFISEALGAEVVWKANENTVYITDSDEDTYKVGDFTLDIEEGDELGITTSKLLTIVKKSGLIIGEDSFERDTKQLLNIQIMVHIPEKDIPKQRDETEALLKQCISAKLVDEIMAYMSMKQDMLDVLPLKEYNEGRYTIYVSGIGDPISIKVYMN